MYFFQCEYCSDCDCVSVLASIVLAICGVTFTVQWVFLSVLFAKIGVSVLMSSIKEKLHYQFTSHHIGLMFISSNKKCASMCMDVLFFLVQIKQQLRQRDGNKHMVQEEVLYSLSNVQRGYTPKNNLPCRCVCHSSLSLFVNPDLQYECTEMRVRRVRKKHEGQEGECVCVVK